MAQVANRPAPLRAEVLRRRLLLLALAAAPVAGAAMMRGVAWEGRPRMLTIVSVVVACAVAAVGTWWALVPGRSTLGRPRPWLRASAAAIPAVLFLFASVSAVLWPETQASISFDPRIHIPCFVMTFVLAAAPFAAMMYVERRSDPVDPAATGAALGASAGTWAGVAMTIGCAHSDLLHLGVSHILPLVGLAALGALIGSRVVGMRARREATDGPR
jgi:hypothetical protein